MKALRLFPLLLLLPFVGLAQPTGKRILVEKITSAGCPSCPWGDYLLHSYLDSGSTIIPVAIHVNNANHIDHMWSEEGDSILDDFLWAHPTLMIDRVDWPGFAYTAVTTNHWSAFIADREDDPMAATVGGTSSYNASTRELTVDIEGRVLWAVPWDVRVNAYVVEDSVTGTGLGYDQLNGNNTVVGHPLYGLGDPIVGYVHNWVLRDMLGGSKGIPAFSGPISAGQSFTHTFHTVLDSGWNASNCHVVLVVQRHSTDIATREILNANKIPLNGSIASGTDPTHTNIEAMIWPNPASSGQALKIQQPENGTWEVSLADLHGRTLRKWTMSSGADELTLPELPQGLYLLGGTNAQGKSYLAKLNIR